MKYTFVCKKCAHMRSVNAQNIFKAEKKVDKLGWTKTTTGWLCKECQDGRDSDK